MASSKPSSANPLGNPAFPGYTSSGGPNWIGDLVKDYNASAVYSYNFAYGGATVNASLVKPYQSTVKSLIDQVKQFSDSIAKKPSYAPWTADNSLFAIWMGVNDVGNSYSNVDETTLLKKIMEDYFEQVEILFKAGARNFAFLNVPRKCFSLDVRVDKLPNCFVTAINKSPLMLSQSKDAQALEATVIEQFNKMLVDRSSELRTSHGDVKAVVVDTQAPFNAAISNPASYGSKDATCFNSNGKSCLWYNDYHPGLVSASQFGNCRTILTWIGNTQARC